MIFSSIVRVVEDRMKHSWKKLGALVAGKKFLIRKVYIPEDDIEISGDFETPPLAQLSMDDQLFVAAFVKTHGSIKQMESIFSISYPTVKNRLNAIADKLEIVGIKVDVRESASSVIDRLERGEISAADAIKEMT